MLGAPADKSIADALDRILASQTFQQAGGLKRFLRFIVNETIAGRVSELKEYVIGVQVFRTDQSFDPRTDPIVRVQARRLRAKLVQYYADEGRQDTLTIEIPKGGYAPVFKKREAPIPAKRTVGAVLLSRNTVAVLPLEDFSPDGDLGYFCKGLRE